MPGLARPQGDGREAHTHILHRPGRRQRGGAAAGAKVSPAKQVPTSDLSQLRSNTAQRPHRYAPAAPESFPSRRRQRVHQREPDIHTRGASRRISDSAKDTTMTPSCPKGSGAERRPARQPLPSQDTVVHHWAESPHKVLADTRAQVLHDLRNDSKGGNGPALIPPPAAVVP